MSACWNRKPRFPGRTARSGCTSILRAEGIEVSAGNQGNRRRKQLNERLERELASDDRRSFGDGPLPRTETVETSSQDRLNGRRSRGQHVTTSSRQQRDELLGEQRVTLGS